MNKDIKFKLKFAVFAVLVIMLGFIIYLGVAGCIKINQQNYSFIKSIAREEATSLNDMFDSALKDIQGYAKAVGEGLDISEYIPYMSFDHGLYIEADSEAAQTYKGLSMVDAGFLGKSGIEVDFDKRISDEVTLVFYAPVITDDKVAGVLVGLLCEESVARLFKTDCYGSESTFFLTTSEGDVVFASEAYKDCIGRNLFTDYYQDDTLISTSLDGLTESNENFESLRNALFNGGDFGYTRNTQGVYETSYAASLSHVQFAVIETFPGSVSTRMAQESLVTDTITAVGVAVIVLFLVGPLIQRYGRYHRLGIEASRADAANKAKSEFLSKMSHDMRTPLNGILGMTDIALKNTHDPERSADCLKKIKSSGQYLLNLVNEVLDLNTIEAGKAELSESVVYVYDLYESNKVILDNLVAGKDLTFTRENKLVHDCVMADVVALQKISLNLLSNAVKYTPPGGSIKTSCWEEEAKDSAYGWFYLSVQDSGIGMSESFMEKMFLPYEREEDVRTSKMQGTGLGLPIVKALAEMMHGDVSVKSEVGKGSTFTVKLYLKLVQKEDMAQASEKKVALEEIDCTGFRCLLVEDNELNLEIAKELLSITGITIETAENGQVAYRMFCSHPQNYYDIVFMDIQMPVMDGYSATKKIRKVQQRDAATIPIIAMTANAYSSDVEASLNAGMNGHLAKPVEQYKLASVLCEYLEVDAK